MLFLANIFISFGGSVVGADLVCIVFTVFHLHFYQNNIFNFSCAREKQNGGDGEKMFLQSQYDVTRTDAAPQQIKIPQFLEWCEGGKLYHENVNTALMVCKLKFNNLTMQLMNNEERRIFPVEWIFIENVINFTSWVEKNNSDWKSSEIQKLISNFRTSMTWKNNVKKNLFRTFNQQKFQKNDESKEKVQCTLSTKMA